MTAPRPWTPSFLDFPARTSTPACVSLSFLVQQLNDHQALNEISFLIILSICEGNHLLDLTRDSHTQQMEPPQKRGSDFPFILKAKHKTLHVKRTWVELENSAKKTFCPSFNRSSQTEMHNEFYNSLIPTLHKTHTLSKSKIRLKSCFDHGLPTIQIRVLIH